MSYNEIIRNSQRVNKERSLPVFSDIIGETIGKGRLADFIKDTELNIVSNIDEPTIKTNTYKKRMVDLLDELKSQTETNKRWLTLIGLLERKIIQYRLYRNIHISYSTQLQRSGSNMFNYILLRAPFMDLFTGKQEVRIYFNKLEDFAGFDSIEELKEDEKFRSSAIESVRQEMEKWMDSEGITLDYIREELKKIEDEAHKSKIDLINKLSKNARQQKK
jgi:hypothetical protein